MSFDLMTDVKNNFRLFLRLIWNHLKLPSPTPIQHEIADYLQIGPRRRIIMAFRGVGKSYITCAYVLWRLWRNGSLQILVVSGSSAKANAFVNQAKRLIHDIPLLRDLRPNISKGHRDQAIMFDVGTAEVADQSASVTSNSILGTMTGGRADIIVFDDIEVPSNSGTADARTKLHNRQREFEAILKPKGELIGLGTPQTEESLYWELQGYEYCIWPARVPAVANVDKIYRGWLAPSVLERVNNGHIGLPVDPQRFDEQDLSERKTGYGAAGFSLQFMLDTTLSDAEKYPLKLKNIIVCEQMDAQVAPERLFWSSKRKHTLDDLHSYGFFGDVWQEPANFQDLNTVEYTTKLMTIDPSGRGADDLTYCIGGELLGKIFIIDWDGFSGAGYSEENLERLAKLAKKYEVDEILIEENYGDGMFSKLFTPVLRKHYQHCTIKEVKHHTQKEKRIIDTLEPAIDSHRVVFNRAAIEKENKKVEDNPYSKEDAKQYCLSYQLTHITTERNSLKHDDLVDVVAMNVQEFSERLVKTSEDYHEEYKKDQEDEIIDAFIEGCTIDYLMGDYDKDDISGKNWMSNF